jgi:hypothetical protein
VNIQKSLNHSLVVVSGLLLAFVPFNPGTDLRMAVWAEWIAPIVLGLGLGMFGSSQHLYQQQRDIVRGVLAFLFVSLLATIGLREGAHVIGSAAGGALTTIRADVIESVVPTGRFNRCKLVARVRLDTNELADICTDSRFRRSVTRGPLVAGSSTTLITISNVAGTWVTGVAN